VAGRGHVVARVARPLVRLTWIGLSGVGLACIAVTGIALFLIGLTWIGLPRVGLARLRLPVEGRLAGSCPALAGGRPGGLP
jgi:hypothetical protein